MFRKIDKSSVINGFKKSLYSPWLNATCFFLGALVGVIAGFAISSAKNGDTSNYYCSQPVDEYDEYDEDDNDEEEDE